jgi:hypothetical protein
VTTRLMPDSCIHGLLLEIRERDQALRILQEALN